MKKFLLATCILCLFVSFTACSGDKTEKGNVANLAQSTQSTLASSGTNADGTLIDSSLNETEKTIVGYWENEAGFIAIRERTKSDSDEYVDGFPLDIYCGLGSTADNLQANYIFTRDNTTILKDGESIVVQDFHYCPMPKQDPNAMDKYGWSEYRLVYDPVSDTITVTEYFGGSASEDELFDPNKEAPIYMQDSQQAGLIDQNGEFHDKYVYTRTDKNIESAPWDEYYEIRSTRDPR